LNTYFVALRKGDCTEWTLADATTLKATEHHDIYRCPFTGEAQRVVLRFRAPSWEDARRVFEWKSTHDPKIPKKLYEWEEVRMLVDQETEHALAVHKEN
jgi:hypothetical protein